MNVTEVIYYIHSLGQVFALLP